MSFSPMEQFEVIPFVSLSLGGFQVDLLTNAGVMVFLASGLFVVSSKSIGLEGNGLLVPSRIQTVWEGILNLTESMILQTIGEKGKVYLPLVFSSFVLILSSNVLGLIPYSFAVTAHLAVTLSLALMVWVGKLLVGFRSHGSKFFGLLLPKGAPIFMVPGLVGLEFLSFVISVVSLSVRLFANMMAGHILLKVIGSFAWSMMAAGGILYLGHFGALGVLLPLMGLETGVAVVQAYVFALLTCIYLADSESGGH